jgi:hypothetical protein
MKHKCSIVLIGVLGAAALSGGCYYNSRGKNEQVVRLKIVDAESGQAIPNIIVHRIREYDGGFGGSSYMADSNGLVEFIEAEYFDCKRQNSELIDPPCSDLENVDSVTGAQFTFLIEGDAQSDILEISMETGNTSVGDAYRIEVVEISEPVLELIYEGL